MSAITIEIVKLINFNFSCVFKKTIAFIHIVFTETYEIFRYSVSAAVKWIWRKHIRHEIQTIKITTKKPCQVAYLNKHNHEKGSPVLFIHGDYGHPYCMLHLADIAGKEGRAVFSLYLPNIKNNKLFNSHDQLLQQAIDKIENIFKFAEDFSLLGVGHSKGAILLAHRQFVGLDQRLKAVCAIAGRLNVPNENDCSDKLLSSIVKGIYTEIVKNPTKPLVQIVPKDDWNASRLSMAVRPNDHCHIVPGMHLSGLYTQTTCTHFIEFLRSEFTETRLHYLAR